MKRLTLFLAILFSAGCMLTISAAQKKNKEKVATSSEKALVVYFSATGNTARLAKQLAEKDTDKSDVSTDKDIDLFDKEEASETSAEDSYEQKEE